MKRMAGVDPNVDEELIPLLNKALSLEYSAIIQYWTNKAWWMGMSQDTYHGVADHAIEEEMEHADLLREKIILLGGEPTVEVAEINAFDDSLKALEADIEGESKALEVYYEIHGKCKDLSLKLMIEGLIQDEQEHYDSLLRIYDDLHFDDEGDEGDD